jgi:hypothetical protein
MSKSTSRLEITSNDTKFKDDDYETGSDILESLTPYLEPNKIIYDPFYCNGTVIEEWKKLGFDCINEKKDAFDREHPEFDYMISNIPFTFKKKCLELALELDKPFMLLMPIHAMGSKWIKKYFNDLQFIIPNGRQQFLKGGEQTNKCWFDTMWVCGGMNLPQTIIKL